MKVSSVEDATIEVHRGDLPAGLDFGDAVAVDTEAMGLNNHRDRLCVVQLSAGDGAAHLVKFDAGDDYAAPNLKALLDDRSITKIFHYARFDIAILSRYLGIVCEPVYCTKIASRLARTYTAGHGLRDLCRELLGVEISKTQQSSDWGTADLGDEQISYAASDVLFLHRLRDILDAMLAREGRQHLVADCFGFLPARAALDLEGWIDVDIFAH